MKTEKCMESKLSGIFRVKLVAKYIVLESPGTEGQAASAMRCLFLKKHTNVVNQTVRLKCFPC